MNKELIIQMAREAGFEELFKDSHDWVCFTEDIERFFQLATEWEREQCAKVCDSEAEEATEGEWTGCAIYLANNIRARGENA